MKGQKLDPETVNKIMTLYMVTDSYQETAKKTGLPYTTVHDIVKKNKNKPEYVKIRNEKREEFSETASRIIEKALRRLERDIDDPDTKIPVNFLTTAIGTLYDKRALADGKATENVAVQIKLPDGIDEYAE